MEIYCRPLTLFYHSHAKQSILCVLVGLLLGSFQVLHLLLVFLVLCLDLLLPGLTLVPTTTNCQFNVHLAAFDLGLMQFKCFLGRAEGSVSKYMHINVSYYLEVGGIGKLDESDSFRLSSDLV